MNKEILRKLRTLNATDTMMAMAAKDKPVKTTYNHSYYYTKYNYGIYMRCQVLSGLLKVSFFLVEQMRVGAKKPVYELFINKNSGEFITYDVVYDKWSNAKVDMLCWPAYFYNSGKYMSREGNKSVKRYLEVENGGFRGILDYQLKIRKDELKQRHKRETGPWDMKMEQIPDLPKDWEKWVDKVGMRQQFIFYHYDKKGAKEGYCSWCEKTVKVTKPKHNKTGKCSNCGHKIEYKAIGKMPENFYTDKETVYLMQKCEDGFVLRTFVAYRYYRNKKYLNPENTCHESTRVIYDKTLNPDAYEYGLYKQMETRWIKSYGGYSRYYGSSTKGMIYKRTIPELTKTILSRTGMDQMIKNVEIMSPGRYLETLKYDPYIEQLAKAGLNKMVAEIMDRYKHMDIKKGNDLAKNMGIDQYRLKRIRENNGGFGYLEWLKYEKANNKNIPDEVISWFEKEEIDPKKIEFILDRMSEIQVFNYLKRQMAESGEKSRQLISTWKDYLGMAKRLKMNTNDEIVYRAKKLIQRHNEIVELISDKGTAIRAGEIAEKFPNVDDICMEIKTKYEFENDTYAIVVPKNIEDILEEGNALHHCVDKEDRYFERVNMRETYILFLRKKEALDIPYYTLEVEPNGNIRQRRTEYDRQKPDIKHFESFLLKWQKEVLKRITENDKLLAAESKKLRIKEYKEMKENNVRIRGGDYAGQLLADVLEADLMEIEEENDRRAG